MQWNKQGLIFDPQQHCPWCISHAAVPVVDLMSGTRYRVYFTGRDDQNRSQIGFFEIDLRDPAQILEVTDKPLLVSGQPGMFDDSGVMSSWIVNWGATKYLYYIGWNRSITVPFRNAIGLAISEDNGKTFKRYSSGPLLDRSIYDPSFTASSCVLLENGVWRMWYLSCLGWDGSGKQHRYHIKYAESHDGLSWQRNGLVCIDFKSPAEYAISRPCVVKEQNIYKMWYSCRGAAYRIGYAESQDGLLWDRHDENVGIDVSETGWDSEMIEYPFVFDHAGMHYMFYNGNGYGQTGIGYAVCS
jgi:hypothetical protein